MRLRGTRGRSPRGIDRIKEEQGEDTAAEMTYPDLPLLHHDDDGIGHRDSATLTVPPIPSRHLPKLCPGRGSKPADESTDG